VTVALWIQVEYRAKQVTSWQVLAADSDKGDLAVSRESLKIDYFSKINLVVVVSSTKQRHWAVAMSTTGTLMLQLAVVISTSLLERESRRLEYSTSSLPAAATFTRSVEIDDDRIPLLVYLWLGSCWYSCTNKSVCLGMSWELSIPPHIEVLGFSEKISNFSLLEQQRH